MEVGKRWLDGLGDKEMDPWLGEKGGTLGGHAQFLLFRLLKRLQAVGSQSS